MKKSQRRRHAKRQEKSRISRLLVVGVVSFVGLFIFFGLFATKSRKLDRAPSITITADSSQIRELVSEMIHAINPSNPSNSYFPDFARERINWALSESVNGRLQFGIFGTTSYTVGRDRPVMMEAGYDSTGKSYIKIHGAFLWSKVRIERGLSTGFSQVDKNDFTIALVHETVHLEKNSVELEKAKGARTEEELRAWSKTSQLVVRPLIERGQPVGLDFAEIDRMFSVCRYRLPCLGAKSYLDNMSSTWDK